MAGRVSDDVTERRKSRRRRADHEVHGTSPREAQQRSKQAGCRGCKDGGVRFEDGCIQIVDVVAGPLTC